MFRLIIKFITYGVVLFFLNILGLTHLSGVAQIAFLSAILTGVNTLIRPLLVAIALPFNLVTFGIASVFANLLSLVIANAICGTLIHGFWLLLFVALIIMLVDDCIRLTRRWGIRCCARGTYS